MTTALTELLVVVLVVMIAVAGLLVVHRLVPLSIRESNTAAIGVIYAALSLMFGISAYLVLYLLHTFQNTVKSEASIERNFTG